MPVSAVQRALFCQFSISEVDGQRVTFGHVSDRLFPNHACDFYRTRLSSIVSFMIYCSLSFSMNEMLTGFLKHTQTSCR